MSKKRIGKGLKALIPEESNENEASANSQVPESTVDPTESSSGEKATGDQGSLTPENESVAAVAEVRESDPLFVENLKKERERRVKAIEAMNEIIRKYNDHN